MILLVLSASPVESAAMNNIVVLISGRGSNLHALLAAARADHWQQSLGLRVAAVISNRADAPGLDVAREFGVPTRILSHLGFTGRDTFDAALAQEIETFQPQLVVLAGFMRVLTAQFVERFPLRIINTHPSLLPAFPGADAAAQAIAHGVKLSGVTVHFVDASVDGGPIIAQVAVAVADGDDAASLHARIQREEHRLLPIVVQRLAAGQLSCQGRIVRGRAE